MYVETEYQAQQLLRSGRLRIEAEDKGNFIRLNLPFINDMLMLSRRELFDKKLLPNTEKRIRSMRTPLLKLHVLSCNPPNPLSLLCCLKKMAKFLYPTDIISVIWFIRPIGNITATPAECKARMGMMLRFIHHATAILLLQVNTYDIRAMEDLHWHG